MAQKSLFGEIIKMAKKTNEYAFMLGEENPYEVKEWIDTGCYGLNAILSDGDILKGLPTGKKVMISGAEATAKSILAIILVFAYLKKYPKAKIIFFETEGSTTIDMAKKMGIEEDRMIIIPVNTVEDCRTQMLNIIDKIIDNDFGYETKKNSKGEFVRKKIKNFKPVPEENREKFIFVLDSLGMLGTNKETNDISSGSDKRDMTRSQLIKAFARVISLKLSIIQSPFIIVNHIYATMDKYSPTEISGGSGGKYMADIILSLTKGKQKEGTEQIGVVIRLNTYKSRFMQENKSVKLILSFKNGLYKYSDLIEKVTELKLFNKEGFSYILPDGSKVTMKKVRENRSKYLIGENLEVIRNGILDDFGFGNASIIGDSEDVEDNSEIEEIDSEKEDSEETFE